MALEHAVAGEERERSAPPKHGIVVAHPDEYSFIMSVAKAYRDAAEARGHEVVMRDLYRLGFDPVLKSAERPSDDFVPSDDVRAELDQLAGTDVFVLVYPIWFGAPPAMIKGYIERVFGAGFSEPLSGAHLLQPSHPLLGGKRLLSFTASGSKKAWLEEQGAWLSLQTLFDGYLARTFWMSSPEHVHFDAIVEGLDEADVREKVDEVRSHAARSCTTLERERRPIRG